MQSGCALFLKSGIVSHSLSCPRSGAAPDRSDTMNQPTPERRSKWQLPRVDQRASSARPPRSSRLLWPERSRESTASKWAPAQRRLPESLFSTNDCESERVKPTMALGRRIVEQLRAAFIGGVRPNPAAASFCIGGRVERPDAVAAVAFSFVFVSA